MLPVSTFSTIALQPKNYDGMRGIAVLKCLAAVRGGSISRDRILSLR